MIRRTSDAPTSSRQAASAGEAHNVSMKDAPVGRRIVLAMLGLGGLGVAFGGRAANAIAALMAPVEERDPTGLTGLIPAAGGFRYYSISGGEPLRTPADYRLTVTGLVDRPSIYTYADLVSMPRTRLVRDFQCVTGWRVPSVSWTGVRLSDLLDSVGVAPAARALTFTSFDGADTESLTLDQARRPDVIVALGMYDKPLTRAHGGPVRLYAAPMYGYKSLKWLSGIALTDQVVPGFWERNGYDVDAWVGKSNGRGDAPTS
jgi:DMSO/TMAO reductase YedYZ molybdopterin-dependent catalytic subunit